MLKERLIFSWSSGKDSALALYKLKQEDKYDIVSLLTTISEEYDRVGFHGTKRLLLEKQAKSMNLPLYKAYLSKSDSIEEYAQKLEKALIDCKDEGTTKIAYGDIFLEDLKEFRIKNLQKIGMTGVFPIWKQDSDKLIREFIDLGFKAITTCVDSNVLDKSFAGRIIDYDFISELPDNIDPCGENGEFHTFVFDGPLFKEKINISVGGIILRDGFYYCDLIEELQIDNDLAEFIKKGNIEKIKTLAPAMQEATIDLYKECKNKGIHFEIVSARRSFEEQKELYDKWASVYGEEKVSLPGKSEHEAGLAIDIKVDNNLSNSIKYNQIAEIWKNIGGYWGGDDIGEYWHFEWNESQNILSK